MYRFRIHALICYLFCVSLIWNSLWSKSFLKILWVIKIIWYESCFWYFDNFLSAFFSSKFFAKVWQLRMNLRAALFLPFYWQLFPQHFLCRCRIFVICLVSTTRTSTCYYRVGFYLQRISFLICRSHQKLLNIDLMAV